MPNLAVLLGTIVVVYGFIGWYFVRGFRKRLARRRIARADALAATSSTRSTALSWFLSIASGIAIFAFLQTHPRQAGSSGTRSHLPLILLVSCVALVFLAVCWLYIYIWYANRTIKRAISLQLAGDVSGAIDLLRSERARLNPSRQRTRYGALTIGLSNMLGQSGDTQAAEAVLREAVDRFPGDGTWTAALASQIARAGRRAEAIELLQEARRQSPHEAMIRVVTAEQMLEVGRIAEASDHLRQAEELISAFPTEQRTPARTVRDSIAQLRERVGVSTRAFDVVVPSVEPTR